MRKTIFYSFKVLQLEWQANRWLSIVIILSKIYSNTLYPLIQVFLLAKLIDMLTVNHQLSINDIFGMIVFFILASLLKIFLLEYLLGSEVANDTRLKNYIDLQVSEKLSTLDPAVFENPQFQNLLAQNDNIRYNIDNYSERLISLIDNLAKIITSFIVLISGGFWFFVPVIGLASLPYVFALTNYRNHVYPFLLEDGPKLGRFTGYIRYLFSQDSTSKEVAIFKNGKALIEKLKDAQKKYTNGLVKAINKTMFQVMLADLLQFCAFVVTQSFNLLAVLGGKLTIGQFSLYFQQSLNLANGVSGALDQYSALETRQKYLDQYYEFLDFPRSMQTAANPESISIKPMPPIIEFKNVTFSYPGTERPILRNFNLQINSGEKIALVGENGAGKTTLIKLFLRFYDPTEGEVLINGINLKQIDLDTWQGMVGALFQDFIKYQFSFKDNVMFGDLSKGNDLEWLKKALSLSGADKNLENLPKGMDQQLGKMFEDGIELSGGQWQKLALARAFFRDAPILILDEPTSAIDAKAEAEIFEKVQRLEKDKTVIIISHRFSTVRNADRILVLDEGKIIEEGDHETLMKMKGLYAELFNIQAQGYK